MKTGIFIICIIISVLLLEIPGYSSPPEKNEGNQENKQYVTWKIWEVDRVASIWLMKRYVEKEAEFVFVEKGEPFDNMIPFDVPQAELQRTHNLACYQVILRKYKLKEPRLIALGKLVWDIEINFWGEKRFPESIKLKQQCDAIFAEQLSPEETLKKCFVVFDTFAGSHDKNSHKSH